MAYEEREIFREGTLTTDFYQRALERTKKYREDYKKRRNVVHPEEMPWEDCPQGRLKHLVNESINTVECALDLYIQEILPGSRSGKHRHMAEEVFFVLEGKGYDLHWDAFYTLSDKYYWDWEKEPKKFEWEEGDFVYIPPYTTHQHFNLDPLRPLRFVSATSRLVKALGFDVLEQVENAPEYKGK
jgi:quercetin dioxygenase-like cupin family protein